MSERGELVAGEHVLARGETLLELGRTAEAIPWLQRAIGRDPTNARAHCLLALTLLRLEDYPRALQMAEEAARIAPDGEWPNRLRSSALLEMDRIAEAHEAAREAVRLSPDAPAALAILVRAELAAGLVGGARVTAERLVALASQQAASHLALGNVALHQGAFPGAEAHYRRALALDPQNLEAMNNLLVALQRQGKKKEAIDRFYAAARSAPQATLAQDNLHTSVKGYLGSSKAARFIAIALMIPLIVKYPVLRPLCLLGLFIPSIHPTRVLTRMVNVVVMRGLTLPTLPSAVVAFYEYRQGKRETSTVLPRATLVFLAGLVAFVCAVLLVVLRLLGLI